MSKLLITLKQAPIIDFSEMEARGLEVAEKIGLMNLDTIEPTEENRGMMKKLRAELNKELNVFEDQRKMIHELITKPYKDFADSYETNIKHLFLGASGKLKDKIAAVETVMLADKKSEINTYFNHMSTDFGFLGLDMLGLNIILSASSKKLMAEIDVFIAKVSREMSAIKSMDNSVRIESLYRTNLDLTLSISTVNADIEREKNQELQRVEEEKIRAERDKKRVEEEKIRAEQHAKDRLSRKNEKSRIAKERHKEAEKNAELNKTQESADEALRLKKESERAEQAAIIAEKEIIRIEAEKEADRTEKEAAALVHRMSFTVSGNIAQLKAIKAFLNDLGVSYE